MSVGREPATGGEGPVGVDRRQQVAGRERDNEVTVPDCVPLLAVRIKPPFGGACEFRDGA